MKKENAQNAQAFSNQKVRFPKRPWEKKVTETPVAPEVKEPVKETEAPQTPEAEKEAEKPQAASVETPQNTSEASPAPETSAEPEKPAEKQAEPQAQAKAEKPGDIHFSKIADAYLVAQAELKKLKEEVEKNKEELEKSKDAYLHAVADFDNYRRRINEERPKNMIYAKGDLAKDVFPVLDNFKLGLEAAEKQHPEAKTILEGFAMIATQLKNALGTHGIVEINPLGEPFNPQEHESLSMMPSAEVPADHVMFVQRVGYKIGDRLLRPASVVIAAPADK